MSLGGSAKASKETEKESIDEVVRKSGTETSSLEIDDEAIAKITSDLLSGDEGLASIFSGEQSSGVYNSSVAAQEAGDLSANIIGEIAKLRAKSVTRYDEDSDTSSDRKKKNSSAEVEVNASFG